MTVPVVPAAPPVDAPVPPNPAPADPPINPDKGFPENTPLAEMTEAQRAAYYRYQNRQTDNKLSAFKGVTPQQVQAMQAELEALRGEKLTADEKAVKAAADKAAADARSAADADWRPKYQAAQLRSMASIVIKDADQLNAFIAVTDPAKFAGDDGEIDEQKVSGHLTALFGAKPTAGSGGKPPAWGQNSGGTPPSRPGESGRAEAAKRFGAKST